MKQEPHGQWYSKISPDMKEILLQEAFANLGELLILDAEGRMIYISNEYAQNMKIDLKKSLGRHIQDVIENTEIPEILASKKESIGKTFHRNGNSFLVNRIPLHHNGQMIGLVAQSVITTGVESDASKAKFSKFLQELNYYKQKYLQMSAPLNTTLDNIISVSAVMNGLKDTLQMVASTRSTVLISGESGTGKEVFASAIHNLSPRHNKPFIRINCAAIPDTLLESELFGYKEGAFTGAIKGGKIGDFEAANGGTLFLDEIDSLSPNMQAKLLRVLQEREIKKLGCVDPIPIDVRLVFATNKDLYMMMKNGDFREDFYYRINVINLHLPPLRERRSDILPLTRHFIKKFSLDMGKSIDTLTPSALEKLENYDWPGNIRELENCIERAFVYSQGNQIDARHIIFPENGQHELSTETSTEQPIASTTGTLKEIREQAEKRAIEHALESCNGNKKEVAAKLGIDRSVLYDKLKRFGLS